MTLTTLLLYIYISVGATNIILFTIMLIKKMIKDEKVKKEQKK